MESTLGTTSLQWLQVASQKQRTTSSFFTLYKGMGLSSVSTISRLAAGCPIWLAIRLYALLVMYSLYVAVKKSAWPVLTYFSKRCTNTASCPIYSGLMYF